MKPIEDTSDINCLLPSYSSIPEEFKDYNKSTKWNKLFSDWFSCGLTGLKLIPKKEIDEFIAMRHIKAIMSSMELKYEHKEATVAYLLSQWFEDDFYYTSKH